MGVSVAVSGIHIYVYYVYMCVCPSLCLSERVCLSTCSHTIQINHLAAEAPGVDPGEQGLQGLHARRHLL